jgi:hypothetical protein
MYKVINFNNRLQDFNKIVPFVTSCLSRAISHNPEYKPYLMTYTFANNNAFELKRCAPFVFKESERLYRHIQSRVISNHARKPELLPYSFEFLDVENTRQHGYVNISNPDTPHVHAVMLFHAAATPKVNELIAEKFESIRLHVRAQTPNVVRERTFPSLTSIHAQPVVDLAELPKVVSYAAKLLQYDFAQKFMSQHECDLYVIRTPPRKL